MALILDAGVCIVARKSWSNVFLFFAAVSVMLGVLPGNSMKVWAWIALPCCLALSVVARRRMS
jgi:hypothetical protein